MGSGKGNKHAGKRAYMKEYVGSKWWREAQKAKHRKPKTSKKK